MHYTLLCSLITLISLFFSGCHYRFGTGEITSCTPSLCIPYVEGDQEGIFTRLLIRECLARGSFKYRSHHADLVLRVCLLEPEEMTVGFAYSQKQGQKNGNNVSRIVVSNEARLTLNAEVTLVDRKTATPLFGPFEVNQWIDFDYEPDLGRFDANAFSLGQLEMHPLAQASALEALYPLLAEKIADYIHNSI